MKSDLPTISPWKSILFSAILFFCALSPSYAMDVTLTNNPKNLPGNGSLAAVTSTVNATAVNDAPMANADASTVNGWHGHRDRLNEENSKRPFLRFDGFVNLISVWVTKVCPKSPEGARQGFTDNCIISFLFIDFL